MKFQIIIPVLLALVIPDKTFSQNIFNKSRLDPDSISQTLQTDFSSYEGSVDPDEYIVSPGDKVFISISGIEEIPLNLSVNQETKLYIPKVGSVDLQDLTLNEAKEKIISSINRYYRDVDVFISLVGISKIKVSIIGDVINPSSLILPGNARLSDLLSNNLLTETSAIRNIKIITRNEKNYYYDFLAFLRLGDKNNNPILREGDIIVIDRIDKTIDISGEIKYPGTYEFKEGETLFEFINICGGLLTKAFTDSIEVIKFDKDGKTQNSFYYSYERIKSEQIKLNNYDRIVIRKIPEYYVDRYVVVEGFVKYPGYYKIIEDKTTLFDIIKEAGGIRENASLIEASLTRTIEGTVDYDPEFERLKSIPRADMSEDEYDYLKAKSRQRKGKVIVDFVSLLERNDMTENVILKKGDVIEIPEAKNYITLIGQVVNPGNIIYKEEYSVEDYIDLAGGFGWRAIEGDVRVIKANTGEWIDDEDVDKLEPGDAIWVPEDPPGPEFWDVFTSTLTVLGQVAAVVAAVVAVIAVSK